MAGKRLKISQRVPASTLLEVVVSMVLIVLVAGIAMAIFGNVSRLSLSGKKAGAEAALAERMDLLEYHPADSASTPKNGDFLIEQDVQSYGDHQHLRKVHLTALDANHVPVAQLDKIIIAP